MIATLSRNCFAMPATRTPETIREYLDPQGIPSVVASGVFTTTPEGWNQGGCIFFVLEQVKKLEVEAVNTQRWASGCPTMPVPLVSGGVFVGVLDDEVAFYSGAFEAVQDVCVVSGHPVVAQLFSGPMSCFHHSPEYQIPTGTKTSELRYIPKSRVGKISPPPPEKVEWTELDEVLTRIDEELSGHSDAHP
jgi:hypothetical protein